MCFFHFAVDYKDISACEKIPFYVDPYAEGRDSEDLKIVCRERAVE
jgi:hypothetical protein